MHTKALFILKLREDYSVSEAYGTYGETATGMYSSCKFVVDALNEVEIEAKLVVVVDNNSIDREVAAYKPTHVFIEGFWVVPEKFDVLKKLHPKVQWIVRCHSELTFLAQEGNGVAWATGYLERGVKVAPNSVRAAEALRAIARGRFPWSHLDAEVALPLLKNYYPVSSHNHFHHVQQDELNIGCFGAIRPLKNQLMQASAAVEFARRRGQQLNFHINSGRVESNGANVLKNLRALFKDHPTANLIEHTWLPRAEFLPLLAKMDISLQVSLSESFNIVTADSVEVGTPVIASKEIDWVFPVFADPTDLRDIVIKMQEVIHNKHFYTEANRERLIRYSTSSIRSWTKFMTSSVEY